MSVIECMEQEYKAFVKFKETNPKEAGRMEKANQDMVISQQGIGYKIWRLMRAISVAEMLQLYDRLNVNLPLSAIKGETFYAGVPVVTQEEIDLVHKLGLVSSVSACTKKPRNMMVNNDGYMQYYDRDTNEWGELVPKDKIFN